MKPNNLYRPPRSVFYKNSGYLKMADARIACSSWDKNSPFIPYLVTFNFVIYDIQLRIAKHLPPLFLNDNFLFTFFYTAH
jgi:hypothetical protein